MFPRSREITFDAALRDLANSADPRVRAECAESLADMSGDDERPRAVEGLSVALGDPQPDVRAAAAFALGHIGDPSAVDRLIAGLDDDVPMPRQSCAIALGRIGDARAFDSLARALTDMQPDLRFQAATSLVEVDRERALEPLLAALDDEDNGEVLSALALALGELGDARAVDRLAEVLDHSDLQARFNAAYALASFRDGRAVDTLVELLPHKDLGWASIEGLEKAGDARAVEPLAQLVTAKRGNRLTKVRAAQAILALEGTVADAETARAELVAALAAWKFEVRALAVEAVTHVGGAWARPHLEALRRNARGKRLLDEIDAALANSA